MLQTVNFHQLLSEEIHDVSIIFKSKEKSLRPIIEAAAKKLEQYFDNPRDICAALCKTFPKYADRDIREYCPEKYKREYKEKSTIPSDLFIELFEHMADVGNDISKIAESIISKYNKGTTKQKQETIEFCTEIFGGLPEFMERLEEWKSLSIELAKIKIILDERLSMDYFIKFMRRLQTFYLSKNRVAELAGISSKWAKTGFEDIKNLEELAQKIWATDAKYAEIQTWFNENVLRQEKNMSYVPLLKGRNPKF